MRIKLLSDLIIVISLGIMCGVALAAPHISVRPNKQLFSLFSLANAAGYDFENEPHYSRSRQITRDSLRKYGTTCNATIKRFKKRTANDPYYSKTMSLLFSEKAKATDKKELTSLLSNFYDCASLDKIQEKLNRERKNTEAFYESEASKLLFFTQNQLNYSSDQIIQEIIIIPNLLDAHYRGFNIIDGQKAFIIVGAGADIKNLITVMHEYLHILLDTGILASLQQCPAVTQKYRQAKQSYPEIKAGYGDLNTYLTENIIIGLEMYLAKMYFEGKEIYESSKYRENRYVYVEPFLKYLSKNKYRETDLAENIRDFWVEVCRGRGL